jgi:hypothetical protein
VPPGWKSGSASSLNARGNFGIDVRWQDGKTTTATIRSEHRNTVVIRLRSNPRTITLREKSGQTTKLVSQDGTFRFDTLAGTAYQIVLK